MQVETNNHDELHIAQKKRAGSSSRCPTRAPSAGQRTNKCIIRPTQRTGSKLNKQINRRGQKDDPALVNPDRKNGPRIRSQQQNRSKDATPNPNPPPPRCLGTRYYHPAPDRPTDRPPEPHPFALLRSRNANCRRRNSSEKEARIATAMSRIAELPELTRAVGAQRREPGLCGGQGTGRSSRNERVGVGIEAASPPRAAGLARENPDKLCNGNETAGGTKRDTAEGQTGIVGTTVDPVERGKSGNVSRPRNKLVYCARSNLGI